MRAGLFHLKNRIVWRDRYALLGLSGFLMVTNLVLGVGLVLKGDRVILVPPVLRQPVWVESGAVSPAYLEEMSSWFVHLVWDRTRENGMSSISMVLRYVDPKSYGTIRSRLLAEQARVEKDDLRTQFGVTGTKVQGLSVRVSGVLYTYVGKEAVSSRPVTCRLTYSMGGGGLRLLSLGEERA